MTSALSFWLIIILLLAVVSFIFVFIISPIAIYKTWSNRKPNSKRKAKIICISVPILLFCVLLTFSAVDVYNKRYKEIIIEQCCSPDAQYVLTMYQVGEDPSFFEVTSAKIVFEKKDKSGRQIEKRINIWDEPMGLSKANWDYQWTNDGVNITINGNITYKDHRYLEFLFSEIDE